MCCLNCCILYTLTITILLRPNVRSNVGQKLWTLRDLPVNPNYILPVTANPTEFGKQRHQVKTWGQRGLSRICARSAPRLGAMDSVRSTETQVTLDITIMSSITNRISDSHQNVYRMMTACTMYVDEKEPEPHANSSGVASDRTPTSNTYYISALQNQDSPSIQSSMLKLTS